MTNSIPVDYEGRNLFYSKFSPNSVHCSNTGLVAYYAKYLFQKIMSVYEWSVPETWDLDFFQYTLYGIGYAAVLDTPKYGVIPQYCTLGGLNVYYRPKWALVANPLMPELSKKQLDIGVDCALIKMQPNYDSIMDIVTFYADMLAMCAEAYGVNIVNSKLAYVFTAKNKNGAESFKKLYDQVASGQPAVVVDKMLFNEDGTKAWEAFDQNLSQNFIAPTIIDSMNSIINQFNTTIGIPNANTDKRERLITSEVDANNVDTESLCEVWLRTMKEGCREVKRLYGVDIDVKLKHPQNGPKMANTEEIDNA